MSEPNTPTGADEEFAHLTPEEREIVKRARAFFKKMEGRPPMPDAMQDKGTSSSMTAVGPGGATPPRPDRA